MIGDIFDATNDVRSARSVYLSLTQFASDAQRNTFSQPVGKIARRAGVSYRTCFEVLKRFEALKILAVKRNRLAGTKERSPSTYTLCNGCPRLCNKAVAESIEKSKKKLSLHDLPRKDIFCRVRRSKTTRAPATASARRSPSFSSSSEPKARGRSTVRIPSLDEVVNHGLSIGLTRDDCEAFFDHHGARGWKFKGGLPMKDYKRALSTWKRNAARFAKDDSPPKPRYVMSPDEQQARRRRAQKDKEGEK